MLLAAFLCLGLFTLILLGVNPSHTTRVVPTGFKMPDGFKAVLAFALKPTIRLWERDLTPPGFDGGEPINTTTQHNVAWRTLFPRALKTMTPFTFVAAYDPDVINDILIYLNRNQSFTFWYPSGDSIDFWGTMNKFEGQEMKEGEFPLATITITPTNTDNNMGEAGPVFNQAAGT